MPDVCLTLVVRGNLLYPELLLEDKIVCSAGPFLGCCSLRACQASLGKLPSDLWLILSTGERGAGGICATMVEVQHSL